MAVEKHSIFHDKTLQRRERNENTEHLPATFALKRMLTRYNFRAACDQEMLHKIYYEEPVAPIIEIPRLALCIDSFEAVLVFCMYM